MGTRIEDRGRPSKRPIIRGGVLLPVPTVDPEVEKPKRKAKPKG